MTLLSCPFCGKKNTARSQNMSEYEKETFGEESGNYQQWHVVCDANNLGCGASTGFFDSEEDAIKSWNTRA